MSDDLSAVERLRCPVARQLRLVENLGEITEGQQEATRHIRGLVEVLANSIEHMDQLDQEIVTDGGLPQDSRFRTERRPQWSRSGGQGLPIPHDTDADQFWLFTCCHCGRRWIDPPGPPRRCSCESTEIVCHRFDPDTYWNIKAYGDPEGSE